MVKNSSFAGKNSGLSFDKRMKCPKIQNSRQSFGVQIHFFGVNNDGSEIAAPNCLLLQLINLIKSKEKNANIIYINKEDAVAGYKLQSEQND